MDELKALQDQIDAQQSIINAAYWDFTRGGGKNRKPPILTVPEAYKKRNELIEILNNMKKIGSHIMARPTLDKKDRRKTLCIRLPPIKMAALKMATQETSTKAIEMAIDYYLDSNAKTGIISSN